jgi:hypothetical protein
LKQKPTEAMTADAGLVIKANMQAAVCLPYADHFVVIAGVVQDPCAPGIGARPNANGISR